MLGVLLRLILVEQCHDLPHHDVHRIVAHLLGDGDKPDAVLRQPADVELKLEVISEEAREAVDDDDIERRGLARARLDHLLEFGPAIIGGGRARLDIKLDELIPARGAVGFALAFLIRNRDIVLGLPRRRDAQIQGGAQRHGHRDCPLRSSARPEQLIEKVAEPCLEHVQLGVGDWHRVGPIVRNDPRIKIVPGRPADARPGFWLNVKIIGQNAQAGAGSGHPRSIAPLRSQANDRFLSASAPVPSGRSVMKGAPALISSLDRLASLRRAGDGRSRPKPRSGGAERASLDGLAAVRPARAKAVMARLALRDSVSGRSSSTRSCMTFGVMRPRSPRSSRTKP